MKYFHTIILAGLMIHFLPLNAEEDLPSFSSDLIVETDEDSILSLDEELALLDEEFKEFKQEVAVVEETAFNNEAKIPAFAEHSFLLAAPEEEQIATNEQREAQEEKPLALEAIPFAETDEVAQEQMEVEPARVFNMVAYDLPIEKSPPPLLITSTESMQTAIADTAPATLPIEETPMKHAAAPLKNEAITVDLEQAFSASPVIYTLLLAMSVFSVFIWLYALFSMRSSARISFSLLKSVQNKLSSNNFDEALSLCQENGGLFCKMISSGILSRRHGLSVMVEAMKTEGKRSSIAFWQKIGLLNDVAIIAPMLGLLGTVLGMFYAFYDINRSIESVSTLFDGLGVSVGTTVAGLIVAILALILHSTAKYRLVKALAHVENEAQSVAVLIDDRTSIYKG